MFVFMASFITFRVTTDIFKVEANFVQGSQSLPCNFIIIYKIQVTSVPQLSQYFAFLLG